MRSERLCPGPGEFGTGSALASPPEFLEQFGLSVDYAKILKRSFNVELAHQFPAWNKREICNISAAVVGLSEVFGGVNILFFPDWVSCHRR